MGEYYGDADFTYQEKFPQHTLTHWPQLLAQWDADFAHSPLRSFVDNSVGQIWPIPQHCLVIGCGVGELTTYLAVKYPQHQFLGIDISAAAIMVAQSRPPLPNVNYAVADITQFFSPHPFDLIIDHHCLHFMVLEQDRRNYWKSIQQNLAPTFGIFILETMANPHRLQVPSAFILDEQQRIWRKAAASNGPGHLVPYRKVIQSIHLEAEILDCGLSIEKFFYHSELRFALFGPTIPLAQAPATLRAICRC